MDPLLLLDVCLKRTNFWQETHLKLFFSIHSGLDLYFDFSVANWISDHLWNRWLHLNLDPIEFCFTWLHSIFHGYVCGSVEWGSDGSKEKSLKKERKKGKKTSGGFWKTDCTLVQYLFRIFSLFAQWSFDLMPYKARIQSLLSSLTFRTRMCWRSEDNLTSLNFLLSSKSPLSANT